MEAPLSSSSASTDSRTIRPINKGVAHRICAGQVILDLSSAVKELVENSLDAGATSIEIALKDYGEESFQVIDNGSGISPHNFKVLALKHHTSKLSDFPDLQSVTTFGFRGEALSSLCILGDLTVETRTKNEPIATHLTFDRSGLLIAERKTARQIGTSVTVKKLFSTLPVRSKEFHRNIRKEYGKLITLLNGYALISKGVRLVCTNSTGRNAKSVVLKTQGSESLKDNIITVFGISTYNCLEPVNICISEGCRIDGFLSKPGHGSGRNLGDRQFFYVNGRPVDMPKVSKLVNELYRGANSRQYPIAIMNFIVPTRACDVNVTPDKRKVFFCDEGSLLQSLRKALEKIYSPDRASYSVNDFQELRREERTPNSCSSHKISVSPLLSPDTFDTKHRLCTRTQNSDSETFITTDKEDTRDSPFPVIHDIDDNLKGKDFRLRVHNSNKNDFISRSPNSTIDRHAAVHSKLIEKGNTMSTSPLGRSSIVQSSLAKFLTVSKRKHESISTTLSEVPLLRNRPTVRQSGDDNPALRSALAGSPDNCIDIDDSDNLNITEPEPSKFSRFSGVLSGRDSISPSPGKVQNGESREELKVHEEATSLADSTIVTSSTNNVHDVPIDPSDAAPPLQPPGVSTDSPILPSSLKIASTLEFSFKDLMTRRQQRLSRFRSVNHTSGGMKIGRNYTAATLELSQSANEEGKEKALVAATRELERFFKKEDFGRMKVIGQFNLGFIIGKLDQDLFIVDQHAADEKYNYEHLSQSTVLNQQPLLRPLKMELSPEEEIVISMHMDIIRRNGFSLEEDTDAPPGQRFKLKAVPFSKNVTFGLEDVKELISILADSHGDCSIIGSYRTDSADSVCPPRVRAMLASRACRSSVMIGDPLARNEMRKILKHLAGLRSPWNCPHGRPTMRHLVDLKSVYKRIYKDETPL